MGDDDEESIIRRVVDNCETMFLDRGYTDVRKSTASDQTSEIISVRPLVTANEAVFLISEDDKIGVKLLRKILSGESRRIVIASNCGPTPFAKKECNCMNVQFLTIKFLTYNVSKHSLVPKHRLASPDKWKMFGDDVDLFPKILDTDPVIKYYDWPVGKIVEIERIYGGEEPVLYYRCIRAKS
tara:strand:+ start:179 stop:727 length:549 start_codon:yes stop_codon:yes gene_type:complete